MKSAHMLKLSQYIQFLPMMVASQGTRHYGGGGWGWRGIEVGDDNLRRVWYKGWDNVHLK